jgi:RNA polymerase sigma factor (sigma-70 family)
MDDVQEFQDLMRQVQAGSEAAARRLCDVYGKHILRVVRHRLTDQLRSKFDSIDFVQDVWASFFADPPRELQFDHPNALAVYLARLARNKVIGAWQRMGMDKRDVGRERALQAVTPHGESEAVTDPLPDRRQHTPSQWVMADEQWQRLLDSQSPERRHALLMLREGASHREVAEQLGLSQKAIQRLLRRLLPEGER